MRTAALAAALLLGACALPAARTAPSSAAAPRRGGATSGAAFRDTAAVRRLCVAPDSVLAGRKTCELRNQSAFRVF